jgi:hypothetical protein
MLLMTTVADRKAGHYYCNKKVQKRPAANKKMQKRPAANKKVQKRPAANKKLQQRPAAKVCGCKK